MGIENFSDKELEKEIKRREEFKKKASFPKAIENPDFSGLIEMCKRYIDGIANGAIHDDTQHYIYECAVECVFGKKIWVWINKQNG